jgi:hypothetical protein
MPRGLPVLSLRLGTAPAANACSTGLALTIRSFSACTTTFNALKAGGSPGCRGSSAKDDTADGGAAFPFLQQRGRRRSVNAVAVFDHSTAGNSAANAG